MKTATLTSPRGHYGSVDDLLVILADGREYEVGFDSGDKIKVLQTIKEILSSSPERP